MFRIINFIKPAFFKKKIKWDTFLSYSIISFFLYYKASKSGALNLPFSADLLSILLDYLYSNEVPTLIGKKQQLIITFRIWLSMFCAVFSSKKSEFYKYWPKIASCRSNSYTNKMKSVVKHSHISLSHFWRNIFNNLFSWVKRNSMLIPNKRFLYFLCNKFIWNDLCVEYIYMHH